MRGGVVQYPEDGGGPAREAGEPPTDATRLAAALEALAARDQVLAERSRRLAALQDVADRLAEVTARLHGAEDQLAALHRARAAEAAARDVRIADLERRLVPEPVPQSGAPALAVPVAAAPLPVDPRDAMLAELQEDLDLERRRSFRLAALSRDSVTGEVARLEAALDAARRRTAALQQQLEEIHHEAALGEPQAGYASWEGWFRRRLAERRDTELERVRETARRQHGVLEEKERLIATLLDRLRAVGEVREGPDDLKEVVGIGPVIEELLHGMGIATFEQLAALPEEEVDRIGDLLGAFRERIRRDRWREQAAELAARRLRLGDALFLT